MLDGMVTRTKLEVANIIESFVEGTGERWDWDDFCSLAIENRELDAIRVKCCNRPLLKAIIATTKAFRYCAR